MVDIGQRRTVEVTQYHVELYQGQWSPYLEAWDVLAEIIALGPSQATQLPLVG